MESKEENDDLTVRLSGAEAPTLQEAADRPGIALNNFIIRAARENTHILLDPEQTIFSPGRCRNAHQ
ncbi:hypothetical protein [Massilia sp. CCM 8734]|uniref:hypothetical protein n=1 Tax=Massilia sp. CCM 8734 TaxID=2609283 RepID=UPI001420A44B|nr:hypothetical protein [Massilia sp. CCM 8734]NIA00290.1 hypothetical protein [Massilia sp. CCM 8734]